MATYHDEFVRMVPNGEVYAIRVRDEDSQIIGVCGPLHHNDVALVNLRDFEYDAELAEWFTCADFAQPDPLYRIESLPQGEVMERSREHAERLLRDGGPIIYTHLMERE